MKIEFLTADGFAAEGAVHAFFTRKGGITPNHLGALNCGSSFDSRDNIIENQKLAMQALGLPFERLAILKQIHSTTVHVVGEEIPPRTLEGDALVTNRPNTPIGVLTADCVPVLFHDPEEGVIGAAHAGWKGSIGNIMEETIRAMEKLGAARAHIRTSIGACIRQDSYEVGPEFIERFLQEAGTNAAFFTPSGKEGHALFDLPGYVKSRLAASGISHIHDIGVDTCRDKERFFSCRRAFLSGEQGFGNGLSVIALVE